MFPRIDMFKEVIFTARLVAFNESFVLTGKKHGSATAIIWHEDIAGRSAKEIITTLYAYFFINPRHISYLVG